MAEFLSYLLVVLAAVSSCFTLYVYVRGRKNTLGKIMIACFVSSAWWSFCFGIMINRTDVVSAWFWRSVGMFGVFALLAMTIWLVLFFTNIKGKQLWIIRILSLTGFLIFPFNIRKENTIFKQAEYGMAYSFRDCIWSDLYSIYSVVYVVLLILLIVMVYRNAATIQRKKLAKKMIIGTVVTALGMILDTLLPAVGVEAIPGSTLGQAFSIIIFFEAYLYERRNIIDINNLSKFVYDSVQEPVLIYDKEKKLEIVNNSAMGFFGIPEKPDKKYALSDLFLLEEEDLTEITSKNTNRINAWCREKEAYCNLAIDAVEDDYGDIIGYIVVVNDLTENIRAMEELNQAKQQAEKANAAKSSFLASMSHEIRTPINAVLGMDEMILREAEKPEIIEYANQIQDAGKTLLSIINEILDFSRIESGKMELVEQEYETAKMLEGLINVTKIRAKEKNLKFEVDIDASIPQKFCGDENRVKQILMNLLANAVKYTDKGTVTLRVAWNKEKKCLYAEVSDTGRGIKEDFMPHLFDSFQRLDESKVRNIEGTGLGLAIVKSLLYLMNGKIEVESEYGSGSTFMCEIPQVVISHTPMGVISGEEKMQKKKKKYEPAFVAPQAKLLAVDDNRVNLTVIRGLLKKTQIQIDLAMSGEDCIAKATDTKYDIILMDHMMPEMDGIETLEKMRQIDNLASKDAKVIVLTANAIVGMKEQYLEAGFDEYLSKPVDAVELEKMLIEYLPKEYVQLVSADNGVV